MNFVGTLRSEPYSFTVEFEEASLFFAGWGLGGWVAYRTDIGSFEEDGSPLLHLDHYDDYLGILNIQQDVFLSLSTLGPWRGNGR